MTNIVPITADKFADKCWNRFKLMKFAANDTIAQISAQEAPRAILSLPIGFIKTQDTYCLVALQGLESESNLLVDATGRWRGGYLPKVYFCHPFQLRKSNDEKLILCVDEDSEFVLEGDNELAERFYEDGVPTKPISEIANFLNQQVAQQEKTRNICAILDQHKLIKPWPVTVKTCKGEITLEALHCIDEERLNKLSATALKELRNGDALMLAFAQLFSMLNINLLVKQINNESNDEVELANQIPEIDFENSDSGGTISFDNL